jgi:hypothetical protein
LPINATRDGKWHGHDPSHRIGRIATAEIRDGGIWVTGYFEEALPEEVITSIRATARDLGFSYEIEIGEVENRFTDPVVVKTAKFTGAALLLRTHAAYAFTAIAAQADTKFPQRSVASIPTCWEVPVSRRW